MIAHVEWQWLQRIERQTLFRYEFDPDQFEQTVDSWMWVSKTPIPPARVDRIDDLLGELRSANVELRIMNDLTSLRDACSTTMHASGIRLRNASDW
jgi:hypothetical protein